jgi:sulfur-carrier protein adenylyltransferase/sulfurtransferase
LDNFWDAKLLIASFSGSLSAMKTSFSLDERHRYSRHLQLPEVGLPGQLRLAQAKVLVVGAGGLGSPASLYLAAAGVGTLGLVDFDRVDLSNLQRQILHSTRDVGRAKTESARDRLSDLNPNLNLETWDSRLDIQLAHTLVPQYDVIVDGSDNLPTRYLLNDVAVRFNKPLVYGSVFRFEGQCSVFGLKGGPCYRCLYPVSPPPGAMPNCGEGGVLGILPGVIGTLQATEAIKLVTGIGESLQGRLITWNALTSTFSTFRINPDPDCPVCGLNVDPNWIDGSTQGEICAMSVSQKPEELSPSDDKERKDRGEAIILIDVREPFEAKLASIGGSLIPLNELPKRLNELDRNASYVLICHHGMRSRNAAHFLAQNGFARVANLSGGIDRWSVEIDPSVPRY